MLSKNKLVANSICSCCPNYKDKTLEECLVDFCAPTLAAIKCANMFTMPYTDKNDLEKSLNSLNEICNNKGINIVSLRCSENKALLYVYRKTMIDKILQQRNVVCFLQKCGYEVNIDERINVNEAIRHIKHRLEETNDFPHEIGIFLGYPYEDVMGFIDNSGKNFLFCGYWKVYENETKKRELFHHYDRCRSIYCDCYKKGC